MDWVSVAFMGGNFFQDKVPAYGNLKKDYKEDKTVDRSDMPLLGEKESPEKDEEEWEWSKKEDSPKKSNEKDQWEHEDWGQGDSWMNKKEEKESNSPKKEKKSSKISSKNKSKGQDLLIDFEDNAEKKNNHWDKEWDDDAWAILNDSKPSDKKD
uniref:Uncharacterized protein n=1 Tax=Strigamia maritima TaxID=126957 RepID=T1JHU4_STRMM